MWYSDHDDRQESAPPKRGRDASPTRWSHDLWEDSVVREPKKQAVEDDGKPTTASLKEGPHADRGSASKADEMLPRKGGRSRSSSSEDEGETRD